MSLPLNLGSLKNFTPKQLAGRAVDAIGDYRSQKMRNSGFGFFMDDQGRAWLDRVPTCLDPQWLITINYQTSISFIAEEIAEVKGGRR